MTDKDSKPEISGALAAQLAEITRGTQDVLTETDLIRKLNLKELMAKG